MFASFNLILSESEKIILENFQSDEIPFRNQKRSIRKTLDKYINTKEHLNASLIEDDWFKEFPANIFISHSHKDESLAKSLASYLSKEFELTCFIDSCVWGYANDLLKLIDNEFCKRDYSNNGANVYSYRMRNQSTSHVHALLNGALAKMINSTECLIFLNTPESITARDVLDDDKTASPWIYSELLMATTFPNREPERFHLEKSRFDDNLNESKILTVDYPAPTGELTPLSFNDLKALSCKKSFAALDQLYHNKGLIYRKNINNLYK